MIAYCKGYFGYKNFGDELLLLGLINYITKHYPIQRLIIESADKDWLLSWINNHRNFISSDIEIEVASKHSAFFSSWDLLFLGGGEVLTDGRPFPYNGWNYFFGYLFSFLKKKVVLLGGIGTPKKIFSDFLWRFLLNSAQSIVVREKRSYIVATTYTSQKKIVAYHDFAHDVLPLISLPTIPNKKYILLNCNPYIRSESVKQKLIDFASAGLLQGYIPVFFPAEIGVDDKYRNELHDAVPELEFYDRTQHSLEETITLFASCVRGLAARLHVLLLLQYTQVAFEALVYQEKITTFLEQGHSLQGK